MSIKNALIRNTTFNLLGYFYLLAASLISISIMLRNLGSDFFGLYIFLATFVPLASVFDFGVSIASVRNMAVSTEDKEKRTRIWQTSFFIFLSLAVFLSVFVFLLLVYLKGVMPVLNLMDSSYLVVFLIISFTVLVNHVNAHFLGLPQANQRFDVFNVKTLLVGTGNTLVTAFLSYKTSSLVTIFGVQAVFHILTSVFMIIYSLKDFFGARFWPKYFKVEGKELWSFGFKNFIGILAGQLEAQVSKFFLGFYATAREITNFNIPQNIVSKGAGVVSQFAQAFFPLSASLLQKERIGKLKKMYWGLQGLSFLGGVVGIFLVNYAGYDLLLWWLRDQLTVANVLPVLKILIYYFALVTLTPMPTALVQGLNKPQIASFFAVITIFFEVVFLFYLVPSMGALGAAWSFLISTIISVPAFVIVSWYVLEKEIKRLSKT